MSELTEREKVESPKCPKCGFVMCEQFDERKVTAIASVVVPNGSYICYHCKITIPSQPSANASGETREQKVNAVLRNYLQGETRDTAVAEIIAALKEQP